MRIVHLLSQTHLTGAEVHAHLLAEGQAQGGDQVFLVSERFHISTRLPCHPFPVHSARSWRRILEIWRFRRWVRDNQIQVIHAHSRAAVRWAWWATLGRRDCVHVSTVHGRQHFSWGKKWHDSYGPRVIAICQAIKDHLVRDFGMRPWKIEVLGNPLSLTGIKTEKTEPGLWMLAGRLTGPKGQVAFSLLQKTLPPLLEQNPSLRFEILGGSWAEIHPESGPFLRQLQSRFPGRVHEWGTRPDFDEQLSRAEVVLGAGRVALTALALRKTLICFGEARAHGVITQTNFDEARASNFGDIGSLAQDKPDFAVLKEAFDLCAKKQGPAQAEREVLAKMVLTHFASSEILPRVRRLYQSALMLKQHPHWIPVLMYHQVVPEALQTQHRVFVTAKTFETHLHALKSRGFTSLTFADLRDFREGRRPLSEFPRRPVILTFDDGYRNNLTEALPLLKKYNFRAIIYLLAQRDLKSNTWDEGASDLPLLTPEERQTLAQSGVFEIGSHGWRHERLPTLSAEAAKHELAGSKLELEKEFKTEVLSFAFTYGVFDENSADQVHEAGYQYALNTDQGGWHVEEAPYSVFRVNIFPEDGPWDVIRKTLPSYRRRFWKTRGK